MPQQGRFVGIDLASAAVDPILEFVEAYGHLDDGVRQQTRILLRFPVKRPFAFPEPRGSDNPYTGGGPDLPLHRIATVQADWLEVGVFSRPDARKIDWDTQPLIGLVTSPSILRLSA